MKPFFTLLILLSIPFVLSVILLVIGISLKLQRFYHSKPLKEPVVFPYLTSWEEAA